MKLFPYLIFWSLSLALCGCDSSSSITPEDNSRRAQLEKFEFHREEAGNELGIFTKVIAQTHRKANQTTEEFSINREYMASEYFEALMKRCGTTQEGTPFDWRNCLATDEGLFAQATGAGTGTPEAKNVTITYLEIEFKPFDWVDKGVERICVVSEVYKTKVFVVLRTFSLVPSNDTFPRGFVESVDTVHQHQLDSFGEHFLSLFGDNIDDEAIYNFGQDEYYDRDPPYECFLSIASSESKTVIEEKCDISCPFKKVPLPKDTLKNVMNEARAEADQEEKRENSRVEL